MLVKNLFMKMNIKHWPQEGFAQGWSIIGRMLDKNQGQVDPTELQNSGDHRRRDECRHPAFYLENL